MKKFKSICFFISVLSILILSNTKMAFATEVTPTPSPTPVPVIEQTFTPEEKQILLDSIQTIRAILVFIVFVIVVIVILKFLSWFF